MEQTEHSANYTSLYKFLLDRMMSSLCPVSSAGPDSCQIGLGSIVWPTSCDKRHEHLSKITHNYVIHVLRLWDWGFTRDGVAMVSTGWRWSGRCPETRVGETVMCSSGQPAAPVAVLLQPGRGRCGGRTLLDYNGSCRSPPRPILLFTQPFVQ